MQATLAFQLEFEESDLGQELDIVIEFAERGGTDVLARIRAKVAGVRDETWNPELPVLAASAVPLSFFFIPHAGVYELTIAVDEEPLGVIRFSVGEGLVAEATPQNAVSLRADVASAVGAGPELRPRLPAAKRRPARRR